MDFTILIVVVLIVIFVALCFIGKKELKKRQYNLSPSASEPIQHTKNTHLATRNEQKFYFALQKVLTKNYYVHCQTSLIALVDPKEFKYKKQAYSKRVDFVITDAATKIVAVIELDDPSHNQPKRIKRDNYVNAALKPHHPLIRVKTQSFYRPEMIAQLLEEHAGIRSIYPSMNYSPEELVD